MESALPDEVREFISQHIVSVEELEVLLLLYDGKERDWTAAEINGRLRSQEASISKWLAVLVSLRLIEADGGRCRYSPATELLGQQTAALAAAYRTRPIKVIELIFSKPNENLLNFARAFNLRKPP